MPGGASPIGTAAQSGTYAVGVRIGGYGFRRNNDMNDANSWNECRMNGLGVFAQRALRGPFFLEAGLDTYFSIGQGESTDLPLDRQNVLVSAAVGVRTNVTSWLRGYAQVGTGVELDRLSVPYASSTISDDKALPEAFFGFGGDIRLARQTYVGATIRVLVMGNFDYDPARLQMSNQWVAAPSSSDVFSASPDLAAQAQFYVRREL
ncbi:MAG TPA: hypothetical protein VGF94_03490 [Kofleriaceae bacterium]